MQELLETLLLSYNRIPPRRQIKHSVDAGLVSGRRVGNIGRRISDGYLRSRDCSAGWIGRPPSDGAAEFLRRG